MTSKTRITLYAEDDVKKILDSKSNKSAYINKAVKYLNRVEQILNSLKIIEEGGIKNEIPKNILE